MSAIWGMIDFANTEANIEVGRKMEEGLKNYKIDKYNTILCENVVLGCGIQYIIPESEYEILPCYDQERDLFYTADCMIDNRNEVIGQLSTAKKEMADGELLYLAYLEWGTEFTKHVYGVFSFVVYDFEKKELMIFADHTGSRSIYYYVDEDKVFLSTVFEPILRVMNKEGHLLNEKWILGCLSTMAPNMMLLSEMTPFEGITLVEGGYYVKFNVVKNKIITKKVQYWKLDNIKPLIGKTDDEYKAKLIEMIKECVFSLLRSKGEIGLTLSSGLDSSTIACIAAPMLAEKNKNLYSFTSVPVKEYAYTADRYYIANETEGVAEIIKKYENIVPKFLDFEGKNAISELKRINTYLELPQKSRQNIVWLDGIYEEAQKSGCRIVLQGQYGNATISHGFILSKIYESVLHLRLKEAYEEMNKFCKQNNIARKRVLKVFLKEMIAKFVCKGAFEDNIADSKKMKQYKIDKIKKRGIKIAGGTNMDSNNQRLQLMSNPQAFAQLGAVDTRFGLKYGLVVRDPLKDVRMIELCASMPIKCFVQDGMERAGVRKYLKGIVPDSLLDRSNQRGLQGADYIYRIEKQWDEIKEYVWEILHSKFMNHFVDSEIKEDIIKSVENKTIFKDKSKMICLIAILSMGQFINNYEYM